MKNKKNNIVMEFLFLAQALDYDDFYFESSQRAVTLKVFLDREIVKNIETWSILYKKIQDAFRSGFWTNHFIGDGQEKVEELLKTEKGVKGWRWETWNPNTIVPLQYR